MLAASYDLFILSVIIPVLLNCSLYPRVFLSIEIRLPGDSIKLAPSLSSFKCYVCPSPVPWILSYSLTDLPTHEEAHATNLTQVYSLFHLL